jgi:hypothetical protein
MKRPRHSFNYICFALVIVLVSVTLLLISCQATTASSPASVGTTNSTQTLTPTTTGKATPTQILTPTATGNAIPSQTITSTVTSNTASNTPQAKSSIPLTIDTRWTPGIAYIIIDTDGSIQYQVTPQTLMAYGGSPLRQYDWSTPSGSRFPPPGISIDPLTGVIKGSGGKLTEGTHTFDIEVSDGSRTAEAAIALRVEIYKKQSGDVPDPGPGEVIFQQALGMPTIPLVDGKAGQYYASSLYVTGGDPPYTWSLDSSYPGNFSLSGLTIDMAGGVVRGTISPSMSGQTIKFKVVVRDNAGDTAYSDTESQIYTINIR